MSLVVSNPMEVRQKYLPIVASNKKFELFPIEEEENFGKLFKEQYLYAVNGQVPEAKGGGYLIRGPPGDPMIPLRGKSIPNSIAANFHASIRRSQMYSLGPFSSKIDHQIFAKGEGYRSIKCTPDYLWKKYLIALRGQVPEVSKGVYSVMPDEMIPPGDTTTANFLSAIFSIGLKKYGKSYGDKIEQLIKPRELEEKIVGLESFFVSGDLDFLINVDGSTVPFSSITGKFVILYFSSRSDPFLTGELVKTLEVLRGLGHPVQVISIFHNRDQYSFNAHFSKIPSCLALPFGDKRREHLCSAFKETPLLAVFGRTGRLITKEALALLRSFGPRAFPFTKRHIELFSRRKALNRRLNLKEFSHDKVIRSAGILSFR